MKLLLDEHVPHRLRHDLIGHDVETVRFAGLNGLKNGVLLAKVASLGFDALLTTDKSMRHEQNLSALPIAVVVLRGKSNDIEVLRPLIPPLLEALATLRPRTLVQVGPL